MPRGLTQQWGLSSMGTLSIEYEMSINDDKHKVLDERGGKSLISKQLAQMGTDKRPAYLASI
jgi:hypothetical protein